MKIVILAGGFGTRLSEETRVKPKPMVEIGDKPIIWHIMKIYSAFGFNEFIICSGYKGDCIKEYFSNYFLFQSDVTFDLNNNEMIVHNNNTESWKVTIVDTGLNTMTGGRLLRVKDYLDDQTFMMTYGDGVADININHLLNSHKSSKQIVSLTAVKPSGRFGILNIENDYKVSQFQEKPEGDGGWINGGFFVLESDIFKYIKNDSTIFEKEPLKNLAEENQIKAYCHKGFWMPMDKLSDKIELEKMWETGNAPWKIWK
jgi:glucose-1-phosphate cytidylyltransferase